MPEDNTYAYVNTAAQMASTGASIAAQGKLNRKTREWNEMMYNKQRSDALDDWNRQNAYNAPSAQMERLKAAGLNPNLVYGQGAVATSGQGVRSSSPGNWNPKAPDYSQMGNAITTYMQSQTQQAALKNMEANYAKLVQEAILKAAQVGQVSANTAKTKYALDYAKETRDISIAQLYSTLRKSDRSFDLLGAQTSGTLMRNDAFKKFGEEGMSLSNQLKEQELAQAKIRTQYADKLAGLSVQQAIAQIKALEERTARDHNEKLLIPKKYDLLLQDERIKKIIEQLKEKELSSYEARYLMSTVNTVFGSLGKKR